MNIGGLIDTISMLPDLDSDTYRDNRTKLYLIHKEAHDNLEALVVPFGDNIKGKKDISTYIRVLPDRTFSISLQDAVFEEHSIHNELKYHTLHDAEKSYIIPFAAKKFPYKIMNNSFAESIADCNDNFLSMVIGFFEASHDTVTKDRTSLSVDELKAKFHDLIDTVYTLYEKASNKFNPLHEPVVEAFKGYENPSQKLGLSQKKLKHFFWKTPHADYLHGMTKSGIVKRIVQDLLIVEPFYHSFYSTQDNKNFSGLKTKKQMRDYAKMIWHIKSLSPKMYEMISNTDFDSQKRGAKMYNSYLLAASVVSTFFVGVNPFIPLTTWALYLAERNLSRKNAEESGFHTGLIGTIRDKLGLTKQRYTIDDFPPDDPKIGYLTSDDL